MRRLGMTDNQGIWIEDNSDSRKSHHYHCVGRKERQVGEAQEKRVKLT
jgi:hypothetical protein